MPRAMGLILIGIIWVGCSPDPTAPTTVSKLEQLRQEEEWVAKSAAREKHATRLEGILESATCLPIKRGADFNAVKWGPKITHNLVADDKLSATSDGSPQLHTLAKLRVVDSKAWVSSLRDYFLKPGLVTICDLHTFSFEQNEHTRVIKSSLHLFRQIPRGPQLEEHLLLKTTFDETDAVMGLEILEHYSVLKPQQLFVEETESALVPSQFDDDGFTPHALADVGNLDFGGLSVVDVDGDGRLDIYVARSGKNLLYHQQPDGSFQEKAEEWGIHDAGNSRGVVFADLDGDADLDLVVANMSLANHPQVPLRLYRQEAPRQFSDLSRAALGPEMVGQWSTVAIADIDQDGDLDIFVGGYGQGMANHIVAATNGKRNLLLVNQGGFRFQNENTERGFLATDWTYAASFFDINSDLHPDLYLANDWGKNRLYLNDGQGRFSDASTDYGLSHPGAGMGVLIADFDTNGEPDLYVSNMFSNAGSRILPYAEKQNATMKHALLAAAEGNNLYLNPRPGRNIDSARAYGIHDGGWAWGAVAMDYDLDGDEDIYQANGYFTGSLPKDL